jgi:uncharacterized membrane protein YdfJ with MMPL/SSD domain
MPSASSLAGRRVLRLATGNEGFCASVGSGKFRTMTIDTLEYVKKLEAAGIDRRQAEAHAEALRDAATDQLATKADLTELEMRLIKYMVGQTLAIAAIVFALLRLVR